MCVCGLYGVHLLLIMFDSHLLEGYRSPVDLYEIGPLSLVPYLLKLKSQECLTITLSVVHG